MSKKHLDKALKKMGLEHLKNNPEELKAEVGRKFRHWSSQQAEESDDSKIARGLRRRRQPATEPTSSSTTSRSQPDTKSWITLPSEDGGKESDE